MAGEASATLMSIQTGPTVDTKSLTGHVRRVVGALLLWPGLGIPLVVSDQVAVRQSMGGVAPHVWLAFWTWSLCHVFACGGFGVLMLRGRVYAWIRQSLPGRWRRAFQVLCFVLMAGSGVSLVWLTTCMYSVEVR